MLLTKAKIVSGTSTIPSTETGTVNVAFPSPFTGVVVKAATSKVVVVGV